MHTSMTDLKHVSIYLYMKCTLNMRVIAGTSIELMKLKFTHAFIFFVIIIVIKDYVKLSSFHSFNNIHKHISFIPQ